MEKTLSEITLDLVQENYAVVKAMQYDHKGRTVRVNITDNRNAYEVPETVKAAIKYIKPDGEGIFNFCEVVSGHVEFTFDEQMLAAYGTCKPCIVLMEDDVTLSSMTFTLIIKPMQLPNAEIESSYEYDVLTKIITNQEENLNKTAEYAEAAKKSESNAAEYAEEAKKSESNAAGSKNAAKKSEENATTQATRASNSATVAETMAREAEKHAETAKLEVQKIDTYKGTSYDESKKAIVFTSIASMYSSEEKAIILEV